MDARERVKNGAEWLDANAPEGWWRLGRLNELNVMNARDCVLGQVFGPEKWEEIVHEKEFDWPSLHGFVGFDLGAEWRREVESRRWCDVVRELEETAERGARLLDEHHADWAERVDLINLDTRDVADCVLGQLYGSYGEGINVLNGFEAGGFSHGHGFYVDLPTVGKVRQLLGTSYPDAQRQAYALLDHEWYGHVLVRRRAARTEVTL